MKNFFYVILLFLFSCNPVNNDKLNTTNHSSEMTKTPLLSLKQANRLAELPLKCISTQYPNKPGEVLSGEEDIMSPKDAHPAFYGCFDWHSSVHGHWTLVYLLKNFKDLAKKKEIESELIKHLSEENILKETAYFDKKNNALFERTYGWAWLLKLSEELHSWDSPLAKQLLKNLTPLTERIAQMYLNYIPKLQYPIRVGTHTNTAFGFSFAYDYAKTVGNDSLVFAIEKKAKKFFLNDYDCPIRLEPGGYDFLSPCLEEADLMSRILNKQEYEAWLKKFLPQLTQKGYNLKPGIVSDRSDGHMVHLDGLNFSRAWCLYHIAQKLPQYSYLKNIANEHIKYSLGNITDGNYEGSHWLASFALYSLETANK